MQSDSPLFQYRDQLSKPGFDIFYGAPLLIVIAATSDARQSAEDCCLAAQNLMLAAHGMGLGTCCIGFARPWLNLAETKVEIRIPTAYVGEWLQGGPTLDDDERPGLKVHCTRRLDGCRYEIVDKLGPHDVSREPANRSSLVDCLDHVHAPLLLPRSDKSRIGGKRVDPDHAARPIVGGGLVAWSSPFSGRAATSRRKRGGIAATARCS
jgi:nitroreductase family protein